MCRPHRSPIRFFHLHRVFLPRALPCTVVQYGMGFLHILRTSRYRIGTLWYIRWAKNSIIRYCKGGAPPSTLGREGEGAEGSVKRRSGSTEGWDHRPLFYNIRSCIIGTFALHHCFIQRFINLVTARHNQTDYYMDERRR